MNGLRVVIVVTTCRHHHLLASYPLSHYHLTFLYSLSYQNIIFIHFLLHTTSFFKVFLSSNWFKNTFEVSWNVNNFRLEQKNWSKVVKTALKLLWKIAKNVDLTLNWFWIHENVEKGLWNDFKLPLEGSIIIFFIQFSLQSFLLKSFCVQDNWFKNTLGSW